MKWFAISGSWRNVTPEIEKEVRQRINELMKDEKKGFLSGGALGVDWIATDEAIKINPGMNRIKIILPTSLEKYEKYYMIKAEEGKISKFQAEKLISQLKKIKSQNKNSLIECNENEVNKESYFKRIRKKIQLADSLIVFRINKSEGTTYTMKKAKEKGISMEVYDYEV